MTTTTVPLAQNINPSVADLRSRLSADLKRSTVAGYLSSLRQGSKAGVRLDAPDSLLAWLTAISEARSATTLQRHEQAWKWAARAFPGAVAASTDDAATTAQDTLLEAYARHLRGSGHAETTVALYLTLVRRSTRSTEGLSLSYRAQVEGAARRFDLWCRDARVERDLLGTAFATPTAGALPRLPVESTALLSAVAGALRAQRRTPRHSRGWVDRVAALRWCDLIIKRSSTGSALSVAVGSTGTPDDYSTRGRVKRRLVLADGGSASHLQTLLDAHAEWARPQHESDRIFVRGDGSGEGLTHVEVRHLLDGVELTDAGEREAPSGAAPTVKAPRTVQAAGTAPTASAEVLEAPEDAVSYGRPGAGWDDVDDTPPPALSLDFGGEGSPEALADAVARGEGPRVRFRDIG